MKARLYLVAAALIGAATVSGFYWFQQQKSAERRLAAWEEQQASPPTNEPIVVIHPLPQPEFASIDPAEWNYVIQSVVIRNGRGDPFADDQLHPVPGALVIFQPDSVQREIAGVLRAFAESSENSLEPVALPPGEVTSAQKRIFRALDEVSSLDCTNRALSEVVAELAARHGIAIRRNLQRLEDAAADPNSPVTLQASGITLRSLLRLLLVQVELDFIVRGECLQITTPDDAEEQEYFVAYPVHDLVGSPGRADIRPLIELVQTKTRLRSQNPPLPCDFGPLIDLIQGSIAPDAWSDMSGPGPCFGFGDRWLLVPHVQSVHQRIADFLTQLRRKLYPAEADELWPLTLAEQNQLRIEAALARPIGLGFDNIPLNEFCRRLQTEFGSPVVLHHPSFREARFSESMTVSLKPATSLETLLAPLGLTYAIRDEAVHIMVDDATSHAMQTSVYDLRAMGVRGMPIERVIDILVNVVAPDSWDNVGGPGRMHGFRGLLVVVSEPPMQQQIERVLRVIVAHCLQTSPVEQQHFAIALKPDPRREPLESRLKVRVDVDFCGLPLDIALRQFALDHDIPLTIEFIPIAESTRPSAWPPIYMNANSITIGGALDAMLWPNGLDYSVRDGMVCVGNSYIGSYLETRLYRLPSASNPLIFESSRHDHDGGFSSATHVIGRWYFYCGSWEAHQRLTVRLDDLQTGKRSPRADNWAAIDRELELLEAARIAWKAEQDQRDDVRRAVEALEFFKGGPPPRRLLADPIGGPP